MDLVVTVRERWEEAKRQSGDSELDKARMILVAGFIPALADALEEMLQAASLSGAKPVDMRRVEVAVARELSYHVALHGSKARDDDGGLRCSCGEWESPAVKQDFDGPYIRPWSAYRLHQAQEAIRAEERARR